MGASHQATYRERMRAQGLVEVPAWIPAERRDRFREVAAALRDGNPVTIGGVTSDAATVTEEEHLSAMKEFMSMTAAKRLEVAVRKQMKIEKAALEKQAHAEVLKAYEELRQQAEKGRAEVEKERSRLGALMQEADEKRERFQDLIDRRMNGYDFKRGIRTLRQAVATDREPPSMEIRTKAMQELNKFSKFFGLR